MTEYLNNTPKELSETDRAKLRKIRHVAFDMDGTIYMGSTLFPYTQETLKRLRENDIGYSFLTNNPTKSVKDYLAKLAGMGIEATEENMYTTSLAAIDYIRAHYPSARRLFLLGTPSMVSQFEKAGFEACADSADDRPDVLVVAFDPTLEYSRLCRAAWWASQGLPYIATNPDRVCPTDQPTVLVDCGSLCACIEHATGRRPDITLGKPDPNMLTGIMQRHGPQRRSCRCPRPIRRNHARNRSQGSRRRGRLPLSGEKRPRKQSRFRRKRPSKQSRFRRSPQTTLPRVPCPRLRSPRYQRSLRAARSQFG